MCTVVASGEQVGEVRILQRGDIVPHFDVRTTSGERFSYSAIWQRKNLVLIELDRG
jgi:hypothetical protein